MSAKIDIDALKLLKDQKQMRLNIGQKLKTASLNSRFTGFKKKSVLRLAHFWKILKPKVTVNMSLPTNNLKGALRHLKKL